MLPGWHRDDCSLFDFHLFQERLHTSFRLPVSLAGHSVGVREPQASPYSACCPGGENVQSLAHIHSVPVTRLLTCLFFAATIREDWPYHLHLVQPDISKPVISRRTQSYPFYTSNTPKFSFGNTASHPLRLHPARSRIRPAFPFASFVQGLKYSSFSRSAFCVPHCTSIVAALRRWCVGRAASA